LKLIEDFMVQEVMYTWWFPWILGVFVFLAVLALTFLIGYLARTIYVLSRGFLQGILPGPRIRMAFVVIALSAAEYAAVRLCLPAETLYDGFIVVVTSFAYWAYVAFPVVRAIAVTIVIPAAQAVWSACRYLASIVLRMARAVRSAYRYLDNLQAEAAEGQRAHGDYVQELITAHAVPVSSVPTLVVIEGGRSSSKKMRTADQKIEKTGT